jgi:hypothetical protein
MLRGLAVSRPVINDKVEDERLRILLQQEEIITVVSYT